MYNICLIPLGALVEKLFYSLLIIVKLLLTLSLLIMTILLWLEPNVTLSLQTHQNNIINAYHPILMKKKLHPEQEAGYDALLPTIKRIRHQHPVAQLTEANSLD